MRTSLPAVLAALLSIGCVQRAELRTIDPRLVEVAGDTASFGPGPTAIDVAGRYVQLELRQPATILFFKYSTMGGTRFLERRRLAAGTHRLSPHRGGNGTIFHRPTDALLVIATINSIDQDPLRGMRWGSVLMNTPNAWVALHELPPTLLRTATQPWAAYLVDM
jgi:hypothetical protein